MSKTVEKIISPHDKVVLIMKELPVTPKAFNLQFAYNGITFMLSQVSNWLYSFVGVVPIPL